MATSEYEALKYANNRSIRVHDNLTVEEALRISINGEPLTVTMRTPGNDVELIHGLLFSEDIHTDIDLPLLLIPENGNSNSTTTHINIDIDEKKLGKGYLNSRSFLSVASCGICGKKELDIPNTDSATVSEVELLPSVILEMFNTMNNKQDAFRRSGGSHAAAAFDKRGNLLSIMEDIGRHNAVDKVVGELILKKQLSGAKCLTVSGRISYEIIIKAFRAKIPVLAAVSAPSSLAVDYAKEFGITLLAFCREDRLTCYSHPRRLIHTKASVEMQLL